MKRPWRFAVAIVVMATIANTAAWLLMSNVPTKIPPYSWHVWLTGEMASLGTLASLALFAVLINWVCEP